MTEAVDFDIREALSAQRALRDELGLGPERFPVPAFVGMISDEIERMRAAGRSDEDVAAVIERATGKRVPAADIARFYAEPDRRHG